MIVRDLYYAFPSAVYLLALVPILATLWVLLFNYRKRILNIWQSGMPPEFIGHLRRNIFFWISCALLLLSFISAVYALMQPEGNIRYPDAPANEESGTLKRKAHDVVLFIDVSASMAVADTRTGAKRLDLAKQIADEFVSGLNGETVALFAFTSKAVKVVPPTLDYLFVRLMIRQLSINETNSAGTDFETSLQAFKEQFLGKKTPSLKTLVLISDGEDTSFEADPKAARQARLRAIESQLKNAQDEHLRSFTVSVGSAEGGQVPGVTYQGKPVISTTEIEVLQGISSFSRGRFYNSEEYSITDIADDIRKWMAKDPPYFKESVGAETLPPIFDRYFQIPLAITLLSLFSYFTFPMIMRRLFPLFFLLLPLLVHAADGRELENLVEAGDWNLALDWIGKRLEGAHEEWENNLLLYDKGTVELLEGNLDTALDTLLRVRTPTAALKPYLFWNIAVTRFKIAEGMLQNLEEHPAEYLSDYVELEVRMRAARYSLRQAQEAYCQSAKLSGADTCSPSLFLQRFDDYIETRQLALALLARKFVLVDAQLQDALPLLEESIREGLWQADMLQKIENPERLQYAHYFYERQQTWMQLWSALSLRFGDKDRQLFLDLFELYKKGGSDLKQAAGVSAEKQFEEALQKLSELTAKLSGSDAESLEHILFAYRLALNVAPLQEEDLERIAAAVQTKLPEQEKLLEQAKRLLEGGQEPVARLYLLQSAFEVQRMLLGRQEINPKMRLHLMIDIAEHALAYMRALVETDGTNPELLALGKRAATDLNKEAGLFFVAAYRTQVAGYRKSCQAQPWETVLPPIDQALKLSTQVLQFMQEKKPPLLTIISRQAEVLQLLQKTYDMWDSAAASSGCKRGGASSSEQEQQQQKEKDESGKDKNKQEQSGEDKEKKEKEGEGEQKPSKPNDQKNKPRPEAGQPDQNLLRLLQELEADDRKKPATRGVEGPSSRESVPRPW